MPADAPIGPATMPDAPDVPPPTITPEEFAKGAGVGRGPKPPELPPDFKPSITICDTCDAPVACDSMRRCRATLLRLVSMEPAAKARKPDIPYDPELAVIILGHLADGMSLNEVCKMDPVNLPAESTVRAWALDDVDGFGPKYARAREIGLHGRADALRELAKIALGLPSEGVRAIQLMIDTEKWILSKLAHKTYGDKLELSDPNGAFATDPGQRQARLAVLLGIAGAAGGAIERLLGGATGKVVDVSGSPPRIVGESDGL